LQLLEERLQLQEHLPARIKRCTDDFTMHMVGTICGSAIGDEAAILRPGQVVRIVSHSHDNHHLVTFQVPNLLLDVLEQLLDLLLGGAENGGPTTIGLDGF
jgi:hypothetical protein